MSNDKLQLQKILLADNRKVTAITDNLHGISISFTGQHLTYDELLKLQVETSTLYGRNAQYPSQYGYKGDYTVSIRFC